MAARSRQLRAAAEQLAQRDGPAQVQVRVMFPGEADAAEHLDAVLGIVNRGIQAVRGCRGRRERQLIRCIVNRPGRVPGEHGRRLRAAEHGGAQVLDRLEGTNGAAELLADRRVLGRRTGAPVRDCGGLYRC